MAENSRNGSIVLPQPGKRNILITSALPYVNGIPHLGNIIGSVLSGDVFARYCRGRGLNTLYVGVTDEYGATTETRALTEGCTPEELCAKYRVEHADVYKWFNISFDIFGRTTTEVQTEITQEIVLRLHDNGQWEKWWRNPEDVRLFQFLGKDDVVFHSIIFPATQIGTKERWTKLHHLSTTEYLTKIGVFGDSPQKTGVASDVWRFFLLARRPESSDTEFTWDAFISDSNNLLLNNLGNFVSRVLRFINKVPIYDNVVPDWKPYHETSSPSPSPSSLEGFKDDINKLLARYIAELDTVNLCAGLFTVLAISQRGNLFLQSNNLDRNLFANEPAKCAAVVGMGVNLVHLLAALVAPYMPDTAAAINAQLRADPLQPIPDSWTADSIKPGHEIGKSEHLFKPIMPEKAQEWREAFGAEEVKKAKAEEAVRKEKKNKKKKAKIATVSE